MGLVGDCADMHWAFIVPFAGYVVVWFYARHIMIQKTDAAFFGGHVIHDKASAKPFSVSRHREGFALRF